MELGRLCKGGGEVGLALRWWLCRDGDARPVVSVGGCAVLPATASPGLAVCSCMLVCVDGSLAGAADTAMPPCACPPYFCPVIPRLSCPSATVFLSPLTPPDPGCRRTQGLSVEVMMQQQQLLQPHLQVGAGGGWRGWALVICFRLRRDISSEVTSHLVTPAMFSPFPIVVNDRPYLLSLLQAGHVLQLLYSQAQYVAPEVVQKVVAALSATAAATATADGGEGAELEPAGVADRAAGAAATGSSSGSSSAAAAGTSAVARMARQLELDELGRTALAARYESPVAPHVPYYHSPVTAAAAARSGPAAAFGAAATPGGGGGDAAAYVAALLAGGDVLRAARVMKRYRVSKPTVREFVTAVGARGDAVALAAVYRVFQVRCVAWRCLAKALP